jgi:O-Antigen ligase
MNDFFNYVSDYSIPIALAFGVPIVIILAMGVAVTWTRYLVFGYLVVILIVPQTSSYGTLTGENLNNVWVKGTKTFFFSFLDMFLFGTWLLGTVFLSRWKKCNARFSSPLARWYFAFGVLFFGYVIFAMFGKDPLLLQFQQRGVINIIWQGMFVTLLATTIRTEQDLKTVTFILLCCLAGREAWGLFRYAFLGGDPQNYYANIGFANIKITFFDINDSILASFLLGLVAWKLLLDRQGGWQRVGYAVLVIFAVLTPLLSARRTGQGGLLLAMILLFFLLPRGRRSPVLIVLALAIPLAISALSLRSNDSGGIPLLEKILIDVKTDDQSADPRASRFYELETAWKTIREEPFFGVGPSGSFKVDSRLGLEYHQGKYDFVHSGFGHVLLKTGFVGLTIYVGIFLTFIFRVKKEWGFLLPEHKALAVGALCGFIAQLPGMFFGAPVIEIRTMLVSGLLFAIPLICIAVSSRKVEESAKLSSSETTKPLDAGIKKVKNQSMR